MQEEEQVYLHAGQDGMQLRQQLKVALVSLLLKLAVHCHARLALVKSTLVSVSATLAVQYSTSMPEVTLARTDTCWTVIAVIAAAT